MKIKICGLKQADHAEVAIKAGADMLGCVFFEPSPRNASFEEANAVFEPAKKARVLRVGLFVDPKDDLLESVIENVGLDIIQLHGHETIKRIQEVKFKYGLPVMKALPIGDKGDVNAAKYFDGIADYLLFDAKPPKGATRPGGNALAFDWTLLEGTSWQSPWLLAGGLNPENVGDAVSKVKPYGVDVSSGVEVSKGLKSPELIQTFIKAVKKSPNAGE